MSRDLFQVTEAFSFQPPKLNSNHYDHHYRSRLKLSTALMKTLFLNNRVILV